MTTELTIMAWTLVLAIVQILLFDVARTRQYGLNWNTGPRDEAMPTLSATAERLRRAQDNLFETLPLFIGAILIAHVAGRDSRCEHQGADPAKSTAQERQARDRCGSTAEHRAAGVGQKQRDRKNGPKANFGEPSSTRQ